MGTWGGASYLRAGSTGLDPQTALLNSAPMAPESAMPQVDPPEMASTPPPMASTPPPGQTAGGGFMSTYGHQMEPTGAGQMPGAATFQTFGGYNPQQYADFNTATNYANWLGGRVSQTNPVGPIAPPPQYGISFGTGANGTNGETLNAGLMADQWQRMQGMYNDPAVALQQYNNFVSAQLGYSNTPFNPTTGSAPPPNYSVPNWNVQDPSRPSGVSNTGALTPIQNAVPFPQTPTNPFANVTPGGTQTPSTGAGGSGGGQGAGGFGYGTTGQTINNPFQQPTTGPQAPNVNGGRPSGQQTQFGNYGMRQPQGFTGGSGDAFLADYTNNTGYLTNFAANAGFQAPSSLLDPLRNGQQNQFLGNLQTMAADGSPVDQMPAWEAMMAAQERNIQRQRADMQEKFNVMGGRFSTSFGNALTDFDSQTVKDQNALLAQMTAQSLENAQGRRLNASTSLAGFGDSAAGRDLSRSQALAQLGLQADTSARDRELNAASQLANQGFQAGSQLADQDYRARMLEQSQAAAAASQLAGGADTAAAQLAQQGAQAGMGIYGTSVNAANALFGSENEAARAMFNAQNNVFGQNLNYDLGLRQLGLSGANQLSSLWQQNLGLGAQLGQQEFGVDAYNLDRLFQEYLRRQPENSPLLPYLASLSTAQPVMYQPQYRPSAFSEYAGAAANLMGGLGSMGLI